MAPSFGVEVQTLAYVSSVDKIDTGKGLRRQERRVWCQRISIVARAFQCQVQVSRVLLVSSVSDRCECLSQFSATQHRG